MGRRPALETVFLGQNGCDFFEMMSQGVTLLKPFGDRKVGVSSLTIDWSQSDIMPVESETTELSSSTSHTNDKEAVVAETPTSSIIDYLDEPAGGKHD